jgi:hypothetical protein
MEQLEFGGWTYVSIIFLYYRIIWDKLIVNHRESV